MTGLVRKAILLTVGGMFIAAVSMASTPSATNSSFPANGINLVGKKLTNTPQEDVVGEFSATIRDGSNLPIPGATVTVNFNACTPDIRISRIQTFAGVSVICNGVLGVVSAQTNALGVATFRILGGASNSGNSAGAVGSCAELRANGVFLSNLKVSAMDQSSAALLNGANPADLAVAVTDILAVGSQGRSNFDFSATPLNPADLAVMVNYVLSTRSETNSAAVCP
jgi:hypothetical protein